MNETVVKTELVYSLTAAYVVMETAVCDVNEVRVTLSQKWSLWFSNYKLQIINK